MSFRPRLSKDEYEAVKQYRAIRDASDAQGVNPKDVKHGWLKKDGASLFFTNKEYVEPDFNPDLIDWERIIKPIKIPTYAKISSDNDGLFDRLVYSDTHVGMNPNPKGNSLYGGKWDQVELIDRCNKIIEHVVLNQNSNLLIIDDLGDFMDGWDGKTARKGHDLPQNMTNQEAFDNGLQFKVQMVQELSRYYKEIKCHNICLDNHSADFGYVVNSAFKQLFDFNEREDIEIINFRKFINHYSIDNYTFLISHGKDDENLKFGLKPNLDPKGEKVINNYIDEHYLYQKDTILEFSKGDSHQFLLDYSTAERFNYFNYPALSPSSNWVQTNFQKGISGFVFFNYVCGEYPCLSPHLYDWKYN